MKPTERQAEYVERVGRWWEQAGTRTAGRILGWLMICEPAHQSSSELAEALQSSSGSISTQVRTLESLGFVERVTFAGDRATYFRLRSHVWIEIMWSEQQRLDEMRALAVAGADVVPSDRPDRVTDLELVTGFLAREWPGLMARLDEYLNKEKAS